MMPTSGLHTRRQSWGNIRGHPSERHFPMFTLGEFSNFNVPSVPLKSFDTFWLGFSLEKESRENLWEWNCLLVSELIFSTTKRLLIFSQKILGLRIFAGTFANNDNDDGKEEENASCLKVSSMSVIQVPSSRLATCQCEVSGNAISQSAKHQFFKGINTTLADSEPQKSGVRTQSGTATRRFSKSVKYVLKVSPRTDMSTCKRKEEKNYSNRSEQLPHSSQVSTERCSLAPRCILSAKKFHD